MTNLQLPYLRLLERQVSEEILFLKHNGHDEIYINTPCPFCIKSHSRDKPLTCSRLKTLAEFHRWIKVQMGGIAAIQEIPRRPIGTELPDDNTREFKLPQQDTGILLPYSLDDLLPY